MNSAFTVIELFPWVGYTIAGMAGLICGSFLTFVFYRIRAREPWLYGTGSMRSKCPSCRHILGAGDLIPVISWIVFKGKCRYCKNPISVRYPIIEIATAAIFICLYGVFLLTQ